MTMPQCSLLQGGEHRVNKEVLQHLNALLFDARVHDKWSYEQLAYYEHGGGDLYRSQQVIFEQCYSATGIHTSTSNLSRIFTASDTMDERISKQHTLIAIARETQRITE
jgi:hypothetical protein